MVPRFRKHDASVEAAFRRIATAEIEAAIAVIDDPALPDAEKVHKARRQTKALRALLRLVKPAFPEFRTENRALRDLSHALSGARDARVMLETFDRVVDVRPGQALPRGIGRMRARLVAALDDHGDLTLPLAQARAAFRRTRRRIAHWALEERGWTALEEGLARTYRHARKAMRRAWATGSAEPSHEWRKSVKYLAEQVRLLRRIRPGRMRKARRRLDRLGDLLGARHDIDMLLDALSHSPARFGDFLTVTQVAALARLRIARLDRQMEALGPSLFAEKPRKVARRYRRWWQDWRESSD